MSASLRGTEDPASLGLAVTTRKIWLLLIAMGVLAWGGSSAASSAMVVDSMISPGVGALFADHGTCRLARSWFSVLVRLRFRDEILVLVFTARGRFRHGDKC